MVDRNSLVFNTVCQMFQLVCILLQAIACCTKRNLKQLFQGGDSQGHGYGGGGSGWVVLAKEESKWEGRNILIFFNCTPPKMVGFVFGAGGWGGFSQM